MNKILYIIFIPIISLTITSCGFFSRMTDPFTDLIAIFDEGNLYIVLIVVGIGIVYWIYDKFTKD